MITEWQSIVILVLSSFYLVSWDIEIQAGKLRDSVHDMHICRLHVLLRRPHVKSSRVVSTCALGFA